MHGHIFDIKRYAIHDGPGIRTTVFLKGCNLHCRWCHNPESQDAKTSVMVQIQKLGEKEFKEERTVGYQVTPEQLLTELMKDQVFFEESQGGVTFSGGEPLLQSQFLLETLKLCKAHKIKTCIDTAGAVPVQNLDEICRYTDLFLYDVKTASSEKFAEYIGNGYSQVWDNLGRIARNGNRVIIRIPVIPDFNDRPEYAEAIMEKLSSLPTIREVELLPYHRTGSDKYKRLGRTYEMGEIASLTEADLEGIKEQFKSRGYCLLNR